MALHDSYKFIWNLSLLSFAKHPRRKRQIEDFVENTSTRRRIIVYIYIFFVNVNATFTKSIPVAIFINLSELE